MLKKVLNFIVNCTFFISSWVVTTLGFVMIWTQCRWYIFLWFAGILIFIAIASFISSAVQHWYLTTKNKHKEVSDMPDQEGCGDCCGGCGSCGNDQDDRG